MKDERIGEQHSASESPAPHEAEAKTLSSSSFPHPSSFSSSSSSLRILLWDIDGTLMRTKRAGGFKDYTIPMLEEVFGTAGQLPQMKVSGMTDLQIVGEALKHEGFTNADIRERVPALRESYMKAMHKFAGNGEQVFELLPGVRELLEAVTAHPRYRSALVTGNIEPAAHLKMSAVGLSEFFDLPGAFGDESHDRRDLPTLAANRIRETLQMDLAPEQFIVIGDTTNDIDCAKHFGARTLIVGTGRFYSRDELLAHNPDALLSDFTDLQLTMDTLARL